VRFVVHIGLGKTGTTTIQKALTQSADPLASYGVEVAGGSHQTMRRAVYDLMGRRIGGGDNAGVVGAWAPFAASVVASTAPTVVMSEEMLAGARPKQVRRLIDAVAPREVVVVVTVRDLASVLGSYWQQQIMMGRSTTLESFLASVHDPATGSASAGVGFWIRQDLERVLGAWESAVPRTAFRIVTVPTSREESLEDRFAEVLGVPPEVLRGPTNTNASVGVPEAELIRRFNEATQGQFKESHRLQLMRAIRDGLLARGSAPIGVPDLPWIRERSEARVALLRSREYTVIGSLDELAPRFSHVADPADADVSAAAMAALVALADDHARLWRRARRRERAGELSTSRASGLASRRRALAFSLKTRALEGADRNRVLAWAARKYLERTR
jgi:hypothetical protein